jgi:hypothetical protein
MQLLAVAARDQSVGTLSWHHNNTLSASLLEHPCIPGIPMPLALRAQLGPTTLQQLLIMQA